MRASCANGWTGGQYSVFRFALGVYLLVQFACFVPVASAVIAGIGALCGYSDNVLHQYFPSILRFWDTPTVVIAMLLAGAGSSALFALGLRDRFASLIVLYLGTCLFAMNPLISNASTPFLGWILLAHVFLPSRPYGSWDARGRVDPGAGWRMPAPIYTSGWIALALGYLYDGAARLGILSWSDWSALLHALINPFAEQNALGDLALYPPEMISFATWIVLALEIGFAPLAILPKVRPWLWSTLLVIQLSLLALGRFEEFGAAIVMLHFFTFDPAWIKGVSGERPATMFYDGGCGLCHRAVRFAIAEDRDGTRFRFAPLEGDAFAALRASSTRAEMLASIDSIVLSLPDGRLLVRASAVLEIGKRLGGIWRALAIAASVVPLRVLDAGYDGVARMRQRIFAKPPEACPILPTDLRDRIDLR